jgi:predicted flavoprotein YhiN
MTGNGRCNVTQESDEMAELSKNYNNGKFLISALNAFSPGDMLGFLQSLFCR